MENYVCVKDFEEHSLKILPKLARDFFRNGAGQQTTLGWNTKAFSRYKIRPRYLRNVENRDISTTVLGKKVNLPIGISPFSLQKLAHHAGEIATVKAAESVGTIFILSTASSTSLEDVAAAAPNATKWFQLYIYRDRTLTKQLIQRAEKAGYEALVLTVDSPVSGIRLDDIRNKFSLPSHIRLANFSGEQSKISQKAKSGSSHFEYVNSQFDPSLQWADLEWLKGITKLPIIVKGILTAEDALLAVEAGASAIMVSNHGGRQLEGAPATIEALPEVVKAVGQEIEVYIDGGISDGSDVFKALALGARMAFIGRSALWGLVCSGEDGVKVVLDILKGELDSTLALTGCSKIGDIETNMVVHESYYSRL